MGGTMRDDDEAAAEARELARVGLRKVMTADPAEQCKGNELIEQAVETDPDAVDDLRTEIKEEVRRTPRSPP